MMPLALVFLSVVAQGQLAPEQIYKRSLPSVATISVERQDGSKATGTAFMAMKGGCAITAWHLVKSATRATARFSNGEEFEVSGLVDKDEKRDVALIRIKSADRPLLPIASGDPEVGSKAFAIGAPRGLDFSISDGLVSQLRDVDGVKHVQFSGPISPGNSGGPLLNEKGEAIGVISWQRTDGQNINFAVAIAYAKALDGGLPLQPWGTVKPSATAKRTFTVSPQQTAYATKRLQQFAVRLQIETENVMDGRARIASSLFQEELIRLKVVQETLGVPADGAPPDPVLDPLVDLLDIAILAGDLLNHSAAAANDNDDMRRLEIVKFVASFRLAELPQDYQKVLDSEKGAAVKAEMPPEVYTKLFATKDQKGWRPGEIDSRESRKRFEGGYVLLARLALDVDKTGYVFGFLVDSEKPARLLEVQPATPPADWRFRKGDVVLEVDGTPVKSIEEMKEKFIANRKEVRVFVEREGRRTELRLNLRKFFPQ